MSVAVVVPLFNGAPFLRATLASVLGQSEPLAEIVLVDDGSTDGSLEIAREFSAVRVVANPQKGVHHARRHGLALTQSPLVAILDQDDLWHPQHLAELKSQLTQHGAPAAVAGCQAFADEAELRLTPGEGRWHPLDLWESFPLRPVSTPSCVLVRRAALDAMGGWPTQFRFGADVHVWWRLCEREPLLRSEGVTVGYRMHAASLSARMRATGPSDYSMAAMEATAAALASFRQTGRKVPGLEERWATFSALGDVVEAALGPDDDRLRRAVGHYAVSLAPHAAPAVRNWHGMLFYHLFSQDSPATIARERRRLLRLLAAWPPDGSVAREHFLASIHGRTIRESVLDQIRREPWKAQDWLTWCEVARGALARRLRRRSGP